MLVKKIKEETQINSTMSSLPENISSENKEKMEKLLHLIKLLKEKYNLKEITATQHTSLPNYINIIFFNGHHDVYDPIVDMENMAPIDFLSAYCKNISKKKCIQFTCSESVLLIEQNKLDEIIKKLEHENSNEPLHPEHISEKLR